MSSKRTDPGALPLNAAQYCDPIYLLLKSQLVELIYTILNGDKPM